MVLPVRSFGAEAKMTDFLVTSTTDSVLVFAKVTNCFTRDMEKAILAGIPMTFTFFMRLYQERSYWWDKKLAAVEISQTIKYNRVKQTFYVFSANGKFTAFHDFTSAKTAMTELNGVVLSSLRYLRREKGYYVMLKAGLEREKLPWHLEHIFSFFSLWNFETNWYRQQFVY
jgi:hypothetical protein